MKKTHHLLILCTLIISLFMSHLNILGILYTDEDFIRYAFKKSIEHRPIEFLIKGYKNTTVEEKLTVKGHYEDQRVTFTIYQSNMELLSASYLIDQNKVIVHDQTFEIFEEPIPIDHYLNQIKEVLINDALEVSLLKRHMIIDQQPIDEYIINEYIRVGINYKGYIIRLWYAFFLEDREVLLEVEINYL